MRHPPLDTERHAACPRPDPLEHRARINPGIGHDQIVDAGCLLVLGVSECALDDLLQHPRPTMGLKAEDIKRLISKLAANEIGQRPHFAGTDSSVFMRGRVGHVFLWQSRHQPFALPP